MAKASSRKRHSTSTPTQEVDELDLQAAVAHVLRVAVRWARREGQRDRSVGGPDHGYDQNFLRKLIDLAKEHGANAPIAFVESKSKAGTKRHVFTEADFTLLRAWRELKQVYDRLQKIDDEQGKAQRRIDNGPLVAALEEAYVALNLHVGRRDVLADIEHLRTEAALRPVVGEQRTTSGDKAVYLLLKQRGFHGVDTIRHLKKLEAEAERNVRNRRAVYRPDVLTFAFASLGMTADKVRRFSEAVSHAFDYGEVKALVPRALSRLRGGRTLPARRHRPYRVFLAADKEDDS